MPGAAGLPVTSLLLAVGRELVEEIPQVAGLLLALDADEHHLGAGDLGLRILDVFLERRLAPGDPGILVGGTIVVAFDSPRQGRPAR